MKWFLLCIASLLACTAHGEGRADLLEVRQIPLLGHSAPVPRVWIEQEPESHMRLAQFKVAGGTETENAEAVVFYFGAVGRAENNIARWESQFSSAGGEPVRAKIDHLVVDGMVVTIAELNGSYARGIGMGPIGTFKRNQTLLAAVVETAKGNIIIQLHGPAATVRDNRAGFDGMVRGFRVGVIHTL